METAQTNLLRSLENVKTFLDEHASTLTGVVSTGARKELDDAIAGLSSHVVEQSERSIEAREATRKQRSARTVLLAKHMRPIARVAVHKLAPNPDSALRMPKGRPRSEDLITAARKMAQAVEPHTSVFVAAALQPDFVQQLHTAADVMEAALAYRPQIRGKVKGATQGIRAQLAPGRRIVHVLDALIQIALANDPALLANWNAVKRVPKTRVRAVEVTPVTPLITAAA